MDDPLEVEMASQEPREPLEPPRVGERALPPGWRGAERRVGQGAEHQVLQRPVAHSACRIRSTLRNSTSARRDGENASKVTAFAPGHRLTATDMKSNLSGAGSVTRAVGVPGRPARGVAPRGGARGRGGALAGGPGGRPQVVGPQGG